MSVPRPFRAIAYVPDPTGQETGRFVDAQVAAGNAVDVIEVLDLLDEIDPEC